MTMLKKSMIGEYILFFDREDELRAGKIYDIEESKLSIHSLRKNSRGSSKLYYYSLEESEVFKIVSQDCAIQFVNEERIVVRRKKESLSRKSRRNIKHILIGLKDKIEFSGQPKITKEYDESIDRFGLDQLDYEILETLLCDSSFYSLSERIIGIDLVDFVGKIYHSPSISDYYSTLVRLYNLQETRISISKYKDDTLEQCERRDLMNRDIEEHITCKLIEYIDCSNIKEEEKVLSIRMSTVPYSFLLKILTDQKKHFNHLKKPTPYKYFFPRTISELVANNYSFQCRFKETRSFGLSRPNVDEYINELLSSTFEKLNSKTSVNIEYSFSYYAMELRVNQIADFNQRFFNHNEDYVKVGDFIRMLSSMISSDE